MTSSIENQNIPNFSGADQTALYGGGTYFTDLQTKEATWSMEFHFGPTNSQPWVRIAVRSKTMKRGVTYESGDCTLNQALQERG